MNFDERDELLLKRIRENILAEMESKGLTAPKLAKLANLNRTIVYDILNARSQAPRVTTLNRIAEALGKTLAELALGEVSKDLEHHVLQRLASVNDEERAQILAVFDAFVETLQKPR